MKTTSAKKMKMKARLLRAALAFAAALLFVAPGNVLAQETPAPATDQKPATDQNKPATDQNKAKHDYALIYGTVWDQDDRAVFGVPIKIRRADQKKAKWELVSDHRGEFAQRVPVGREDYIVWADIKVPKGRQKPETKAHIESNERIDVSLHLTK
jgi:hypothetical protein